MSLGFIKGAYNAATGTLDAFSHLSDALVREGFPRMVSRSGDREYADQLRIWNDRMVLRADIDGRHVYATKRWQGKTWYQIHPDPVAVPTNPPTSNHGKRRANDLTYPYNDDGTAAHRRARVLAPRFNITCEGLGFSSEEPWHWTFWGSLGVIILPASLTPATKPTPKPAPTPDPEPEPTLEELMAFKSVAVGYRPQSDNDAIESTALDWEDGATLDLHNTAKAYSESFADGITDGGLKILTKGHYDYVIAKFAEHQKTMRARELEVARAAANA